MSCFLDPKEGKVLNEKSLFNSISPIEHHRIEYADGNELVILVHGWISSKNTLSKLAERFKKENYCVFRMDLSTTFGSMKNLEEEIKYQLETIKHGVHFKKVHFVAHSMGGLVTQIILQEHKFSNLGRVVTLGTPYLGSPMWKRVLEMDIPILKKSYAIVNNTSLVKKATEGNYKNKKFEMGLIAGTKSYILKKLTEIEQRMREGVFKEENDGSVASKSALGLYNGFVKDTKKIKKNHMELVEDIYPFKLTLKFLKTGKFS